MHVGTAHNPPRLQTNEAGKLWLLNGDSEQCLALLLARMHTGGHPACSTST